MATAVADVLPDLVEAGIAIVGQIFNEGADKDFRSSWTQVQVGDLTSKNAKKNVMVVFTDHDASKLVNSKMTIRECTCPNSGSVLTYSCYVFDSGPFVLKGDGWVMFLSAIFKLTVCRGYLNWAFAGNQTRDGNNVSRFVLISSRWLIYARLPLKRCHSLLIGNFEVYW